MAIEKMSAELSSRMVAMAEVEHDNALSDAQKAEKLKLMKSETLERIKAEMPNLSISSQTILANIGKIVQNEDWAKLPPPKMLSHSIALANSVTEALNSIKNKMLPDVQGFMALYLKILNDWKVNLSNSEIHAMGQQFEAARKEFDLAEKSAKEGRNSAIISGVVGAVSAMASFASKVGVAYIASRKFSLAKPDAKTIDEKQKLQAKQNEVLKELRTEKKQMREIKNEIGAVNTELNRLKSIRSAGGNPKEMEILDLRIKSGEARLKTLEDRKFTQEQKIEAVKKEFDSVSNQMAPLISDIKEKTEDASRSVQQWRSMNDIIDACGSFLQSGGKVASGMMDFESAKSKIDSDKSAFDKSMAGMFMQNAHKDSQDLHDAANSCISGTGAMVQSITSTESYAIRTS